MTKYEKLIGAGFETKEGLSAYIKMIFGVERVFFERASAGHEELVHFEHKGKSIVYSYVEGKWGRNYIVLVNVKDLKK